MGRCRTWVMSESRVCAAVRVASGALTLDIIFLRIRSTSMAASTKSFLARSGLTRLAPSSSPILLSSLAASVNWLALR